MTHLGLIGIGVMGSELAQNFAEKGHDLSLLDRSAEKMEAVLDTAKAQNLPGKLTAFVDMSAFVASLKTPRSIMVLVPSGDPLDQVIAGLRPLLAPGDLICDLGNSNWENTEARAAELEGAGLQFLGVGISGGAEGARSGPSIMAGGTPSSWSQIEAPLKDAAAKSHGSPCCDWFGPGGAGHFIKMLHNGIEYADMQLIAEAYGLMRDGFGMGASEIGDVFAGWMSGPLNSYLIEIAAEVCHTTDPKSGKPILDVIHDAAGQKGTGRWSVIEALHLGAGASMIAAAVEARNLSADWDARQSFEGLFGPGSQPLSGDKATFLAKLEQAMLAAKISAYAQGFQVLSRASERQKWTLDLAAIARVWRAGCIIRSVLLDDIAAAFEADSTGDLAAAPYFSKLLHDGTDPLRDVVAAGLGAHHALPSFTEALNYHNARRTGLGTANMIQGLRDRFGSHGFERRDDRGTASHGPWYEG